MGHRFGRLKAQSQSKGFEGDVKVARPAAAGRILLSWATNCRAALKIVMRWKRILV
jgi:hypothetical protein